MKLIYCFLIFTTFSCAKPRVTDVSLPPESLTVMRLNTEYLKELNGNFKFIECINEKEKTYLILLPENVQISVGDLVVYQNRCSTEVNRFPHNHEKYCDSYLTIKNKTHKSYLKEYLEKD